jgi:hypothetical protein
MNGEANVGEDGVRDTPLGRREIRCGLPDKSDNVVGTCG